MFVFFSSWAPPLCSVAQIRDDMRGCADVSLVSETFLQRHSTNRVGQVRARLPAVIFCNNMNMYAPVAHLERLEFSTERKEACAIMRAPLNSSFEANAPRFVPVALLPLTVPFRASPLKRCGASGHFNIMLSCSGSADEFFSHCSTTLGAACQLLQDAGASWCDVSGVIVQLADISNFAVFNQCYARCVPQSSPPTRFSVCVALERPVLFVICMQVCSRSSKHMHVESVSFWAPANIGPYSQAQTFSTRGHDCSSLLLVSGQIALIPERMVLVAAEGGAQQQLEAECARVVSNLAAVMAANDVDEYAPCCHWHVFVQFLMRCCVLIVRRHEQVGVLHRCCLCVRHRRRLCRRRCCHLLQKTFCHRVP